MKIYCLLCVFVIFGCAVSQHQINKIDDYKILNKLIKNNNIEILNENYSRSKNPKTYLKRYLNYLEGHGKNKVNDSLIEVLNGKISWIFSKPDIDYMLKKYPEWKKGTWNKDSIISQVELYDQQKLPRETEKPIFKISPPIYDETKQKAFLIKIKHEGFRKTLVQIILMQKDKGEWNIVGKLFSGYY